jgi:hypothetical protein
VESLPESEWECCQCLESSPYIKREGKFTNDQSSKKQDNNGVAKSLK